MFISNGFYFKNVGRYIIVLSKDKCSSRDVCMALKLLKNVQRYFLTLSRVGRKVSI